MHQGAGLPTSTSMVSQQISTLPSIFIEGRLVDVVKPRSRTAPHQMGGELRKHALQDTQ